MADRLAQRYDVVFSEAQIQTRIAELAAEIRRDYAGQNPILVSMLKGSLYFLSDLSRALDFPHAFDMVGIRRKRDQQNMVKAVHFDRAPSLDLSGRHVLVLEEVVRSGLTSNLLLRYLEGYNPASLQLCAFLFNPDQCLLDLPLRYVGFEIDYQRFVGYGMDYHEQDRHLPFIAKLDPARYAAPETENA